MNRLIGVAALSGLLVLGACAAAGGWSVVSEAQLGLDYSKYGGRAPQLHGLRNWLIRLHRGARRRRNIGLHRRGPGTAGEPDPRLGRITASATSWVRPATAWGWIGYRTMRKT